MESGQNHASKKVVPAAAAQWLVKTLERRGIPLKKILGSVCLDKDWLHNPDAIITPANFLKIVKNGLTLSADEDLGLRIGREQNLTGLGFWGYAIMCSHTLKEAADVAVQYWKVSGSLVDIVRKSEGDIQIWEILPPYPYKEPSLWRYAVEEMLSTWYSSTCFLAGGKLPLTEIHLSYPEPGYSRLYREMFQCPIYYDHTIDSVSFPTELLDISISMGHDQMAEVCTQRCEELADKWGRRDELVESIRTIVTSSSFRERRLEEVARQIGVSGRTLRRKLKEQGTTFQKVLDETRAEYAKHYIENTALTIEQIADRIGFSEATNFRAAFRKWTGMTTGGYREKAKGKEY
ncbi:MAG: AraC family transcriptional regulator [Proteobacteria bacterium]|nr:AraC family transcriptional regulator [Pseudomonadota bacterium]